MKIRHAAPLGGLALVALLHTWPLAAHLSTHLAGTHIGDNASFAWNVWWMREALARPDASFFYTDALFAPGGASLVLHTHTALGAAAAALLPVEVIPATNLLVIACVALNGWSAYALALLVTRSVRAAALAGVLFMTAPPLAVRLLGHFNLLYAWTLVGAIALFMHAYDRRSARWSAAAGAVLGLVAWADYYLFVYAAAAAVILAVAASVSVRMTRERRIRSPLQRTAGVLLAAAVLLGFGALATGRTSTNLFTAAWALAFAWAGLTWRFTLRVEGTGRGPGVRALTASALALAVVLAPLVFHAAALWRAGDYVAPPLFWRSAPAGFDLATLVMGPPWHPLTGTFTRDAYAALEIDHIEMSGWLGAVAPLLAVLAVRERAAHALRRRWAILAVVFVVWGAGAFLHVAGVNTGIVLPQQALRYVPVVSNARMPARALIVASLALSVLAAIWARGRRPAVVWAICAGALAEQLVAPLAIVTVPQRRVDEMLAVRPPGAVLEVPFGYRDGFGVRGRFDEAALLGQVRHGHPIAGGFLARVPPSVERRYAASDVFRSLMEDAPRGELDAPTCERAQEILGRSGLQYLVAMAEGRHVLYSLEDRCSASAPGEAGSRRHRLSSRRPPGHRRSCAPWDPAEDTDWCLPPTY